MERNMNDDNTPHGILGDMEDDVCAVVDFLFAAVGLMEDIKKPSDEGIWGALARTMYAAEERAKEVKDKYYRLHDAMHKQGKEAA
jgi:hypothetical protein